MKSISKYRGLCVACIYNQTCTFPRNESLPILQCEEFEVKTGQSGKTRNRAKNADRAEDPNKKEGICAVCEERKSCTFPGARRQVLFCDEFRGIKSEAFYVDHT